MYGAAQSSVGGVEGGRNKQRKVLDVMAAGGGGLAAACGLQGSGLRAAALEQRREPLAVKCTHHNCAFWLSLKILTRLGVWQTFSQGQLLSRCGSGQRQLYHISFDDRYGAIAILGHIVE